MSPMTSMKNTIVLGCFILVGFAMHAYLNAYWTRFEKGPFRPDDSLTNRFNKMTGSYELHMTKPNKYYKAGWNTYHHTK